MKRLLLLPVTLAVFVSLQAPAFAGTAQTIHFPSVENKNTTNRLFNPPLKIKYYILLLPLCGLLASCAEEDFAMLGVIATGAATNYSGGDGGAAMASLLQTQEQTVSEEAGYEYTDAANTTSSTASTTYVTASPVAGKPGFAISPHGGKAVDVGGIAAGALVEDPTAPESRFRVPQNSASSSQTKSSRSTVTGTWVNNKLTWKFRADGKATMTVSSINSNGVSTTYMTYRADPTTGVFAYTITRATLTGSLNCNGQSDYDMTVNKSYTEKYSISGNTFTIGTEVMTRKFKN